MYITISLSTLFIVYFIKMSREVPGAPSKKTPRKQRSSNEMSDTASTLLNKFNIKGSPEESLALQESLASAQSSAKHERYLSG